MCISLHVCVNQFYDNHPFFWILSLCFDFCQCQIVCETSVLSRHRVLITNGGTSCKAWIYTQCWSCPKPVQSAGFICGMLSWCWWNLLISANQIAQIVSCEWSMIHVPDHGWTNVLTGNLQRNSWCCEMIDYLKGLHPSPKVMADFFQTQKLTWCPCPISTILVGA